VEIELSLQNAAGDEVNRNGTSLLLFPATPPERTTSVQVAERWDGAIARHVADGGRAVIVATEDGALPSGGNLAIRAREGTRWKGEWAQGMTWLRSALTWDSPLLPRMDLTWAGLTPAHVIHGFKTEAPDDVLAGLYLGWIHSTVATVGAFRHGFGSAIVCTFPVLDDDPLAAWMLARLCQIAAAPSFAPSTELADA
jgi:hypothetical protein